MNLSQGLSYDKRNQIYTYNEIPVKVTESDTSYIFKSIDTGNLLYFIDYNQLLYKKNETEILQLALMSEGKQYVPTSLLMPKNFDTFIHCDVNSSLTSLKQLFAWLKLIIQKINGNYLNDFRPFKELQIAQIFENLNINDISEENQKCFHDSFELFDFDNNLEKITWFCNIKNTNIVIPTVENLSSIHPREAFILANNIMRYVCVWEMCSNINIENVIASNLIFIYFLQDTSSSTNAYTPLLPIMQALAISSTMPCLAPTNLLADLDHKASLMFKRGKFNRDDNRGLYKFQMKVKNSNRICSREDCLDILQYLFFEYNIFKNEEFDVVIAYMRKTFYFYKKPELYIYILVFGLSLSGLRVSKPVKNITGTKNLANFKIDNVAVRNVKSEMKKQLYKEMKDDIAFIFNFLDPYKNYVQSLEKQNSAFKIDNLTDEVLFYFMKSNNTFSELVNYILKTILPLITSQLI